MTLVYSTVGTVDRTALCDDPTCAQFREPLNDHRVVHRPQPERGKKGNCPYCNQKLHNWHDADMTIQLQCQLRQIFSLEQIKNLETLNAVIHDQISKAIKEGKITQWATLPRVRELTEAVLSGSLSASATATGTTPAASGPARSTTTATSPATAPATTPSTPAPAAVAASVAPAPVPATVPSSGARVVPADVAARLAVIMGGARVTP